MLKKHGQLFLTTVIIFDSIVIAFSWLAAYTLHFETPFGPVPHGPIPDSNVYFLVLIPIWIVFMFNVKLCGLYRPLRGKPVTAEFYNIIKV
ncbi:MAG: undecaprenyl-phosphate glucose phosphotransferase, partial [Nitrospinae bacterium]|nr:undecaprenyl-phosphate glucose phosphotransferase [Nitrospinota bacterium]